jgi:streptogramin lyase
VAVWVLDSGGLVFVIDPATLEVAAQLQTGRGRPASMAIGEGAVWVANYEDASVTRIDPVAVRVEEAIAVGAKPIYLVAGVGGVWVTLQIFGGGVAKIDPSTNMASRLDLDAIPKAAGHGVLWVDQHRGFDLSALLRFDPETGDKIEIGEFVNLGRVVPDDRGVWIDHQFDGDWAVSLIDPASNRVDQTFPLPEGAQPGSLTVIDGVPIVGAFFPEEELPQAVSHRRPLFRIDPSTRRPVQRLTLQKHYDLAAGYGAVWAYEAVGREVLRIDPDDLAITHRVEVGEELRGIDVEHD